MTDLILLEDEPVLAQELFEFLEECGYRTEVAADLAQFAQVFDAQRHGLAVIDLNLPDGDGLDLIRRMRESGHRLGIVVLTARGTTRERIAGLGGGADYYLSKGCDLDELAAVLCALERRLQFDGHDELWRLDWRPRRLLVPGGEAVRLSQQDLLVLNTLMAQAGKVVSRQQIVEALGESYLDYDQRRLDTQMRRLRRNIEEASGQVLPVKTLRNAGYCFYSPARIVL
ncbi:response regulator transcription factor [Pseudomonas fontis]|uniref:Response regulator transcription factor n=1 Tax=Pseudomonas fontis TaxID=2942633 RepID=A0ABT5NN46_9PSED|nr:response regulator transcription factor [Pseudomonas fontis]MDD0973285.1 response regulator transcription factor [Pseudomonas fontis]MDD0989583.1 response regulator transcription factor [Pseudomonas fontis]